MNTCWTKGRPDGVASWTFFASLKEDGGFDDTFILDRQTSTPDYRTECVACANIFAQYSKKERTAVAYSTSTARADQGKNHISYLLAALGQRLEHGRHG